MGVRGWMGKGPRPPHLASPEARAESITDRSHRQRCQIDRNVSAEPTKWPQEEEGGEHRACANTPG